VRPSGKLLPDQIMKKLSLIFFALILLLTLVIKFLPSTPVVAAAKQDNSDERLVSHVISESFTDDLDAIKKRKKLRALVVFSQTDFYFSDNATPVGMQVDLLTQFEKHLNKGVKKAADQIRIQYIPTTFDRLIPDLIEGKGDVIAALLTVTPEREKTIDFITAGRSKVQEMVVSNRAETAPTSLDDLAGKEIYVLKNSSYAEHLALLNKSLKDKKLKPVKITEADAHLGSEDILQMVNAGAVSLTVVDDYKAKIWAEVLDNLNVHEDLVVKADNHIGWGIRKTNPLLKKSLNEFLQQVKKGTYMGNMLFKRYYRDTKWIEKPAAEEHLKRFEHLISLFRKYGEKYGFEALALAAQGFQESKFDQSLRSHRGAVGIMQLLPSTAADKNIDIPDIETEERNIEAGAKYMAFIRDRYFSDPAISEVDKMAFSWAAYNAGPAKVQKMRDEAGKMGLNINQWFNNVEVAAGKIVGRETVEYVSNIFKYYVAYALVVERKLQAAE
jgi:membrane-bound lytic murein transglycosylase MltF